MSPLAQRPGKEAEDGAVGVREVEEEQPLEALAASLAVLGDRWTLMVVASLLFGSLTFGELRRSLPGIAANVLSERLRRLEAAGAITSDPYSTRPLRVRYRLTGRGVQLRAAVAVLASWGAPGGHVGWPLHPECGTPLRTAWSCPHCRREVDPGELEEDLGVYA